MTTSREQQFDQYQPFLCHYTSRYAALAHILPLRLLRLAPFELMRDPLEAKDRYIGVAGSFSPGTPDWHRMLNAEQPVVNERVNEILKREFKVLSMTADSTSSSTGAESGGHFGRGYARPRMWEQYAEGHRGVCLLFSHEGLARALADQLGHLRWSRHGAVSYRKMSEGMRADPQVSAERLRLDGHERVIEDLIDQLAPALFFEKYDDYATEQEFRFVARCSDERFLFAGFGDCLKGVVLGAEFPESELRPLLFECAEIGTALLRMSWRQGLGQIEGFYNPTIPIEHNHAQQIEPFRGDLARWHPTLAEYEGESG